MESALMLGMFVVKRLTMIAAIALICSCVTTLHTTRYPDGTVKEQWTTVRNVENGPAKTWYPDGRIKSIVNFSYGTRLGEYRIWKPNGVLSDSGSYATADGRVVCKTWNTNGNLCSITVHEAGTLLEKTVYDSAGKAVADTGISSANSCLKRTIEDINKSMLSVSDDFGNVYSGVISRSRYACGKVTARFRINGCGLVDSCEIIRPAIDDIIMLDRIRSIIMKMQFSMVGPCDSCATIIEYPFVFRSAAFMGRPF